LHVASDLDVADEAGVQWHLVPNGAVIGVEYIQRAASNVEIVERDVHPPVEGAARVVVHPHARAIKATAAGRTGVGGPGDTVGGGPETDALAAAAPRQVAGEPLAQARVVHHDRVTKVSAVAGAQRLAGVPRSSVIGRVGETGVANARSAAVVVVDDPGVVGPAP
jgi:hypothetical protein